MIHSSRRTNGRNGAAKPSRNDRGGMMLIEVLVAITLLAVILVSIGRMVFQITLKSHAGIGGAYRNGALMHEVNRLQSLPFDALPVGTTTTVKSDPRYPHTTIVRVDSISERQSLKLRRVTLVIVPANTLYRPDTTIFLRSYARTTTVLNDSTIQ